MAGCPHWFSGRAGRLSGCLVHRAGWLADWSPGPCALSGSARCSHIGRRRDAVESTSQIACTLKPVVSCWYIGKFTGVNL